MPHVWGPARHSKRRWPAALATGQRRIRLYLAPMHLIEAPIGALFIAPSWACITLAVLLSFLDNTSVWTATGTISLLALIAFLISRTIRLPQIGDDIVNWRPGRQALHTSCTDLRLPAGVSVRVATFLSAVNASDGAIADTEDA